MKKLIWLALISLIFSSCRKTENIEPTKPILVKVEAVHLDGSVISSNIIVVR